MQRAADGEARAVQRVHELGLARAVGPELDVRAARLERLGVAARRDLAVRLLARAATPRCRRSSPRRSPCRRCTAAPCGTAARAASAPPRRCAVSDSSSSYDCSGVGELHQLDLVELVLADQAAHVVRRTSRPRCGSTACRRCSESAAAGRRGSRRGAGS